MNLAGIPMLAELCLDLKGRGISRTVANTRGATIGDVLGSIASEASAAKS